MTQRYSFIVDRHLVDGNVVWSQDNMDSVNSTLSNTMSEDYETAEEDSPTQYLSVLDSTGEISLENLNITLANPKLEVEETVENFITEEILEQVPEELNDQQVVVFTVEGSDELYGVQIAQDEEGNLQKYQFQFRKNDDGQLEAIPETIQLLPMDEDVPDVGNEVLEQWDESVAEEIDDGEEESVHVYVEEDNSSEHILPDEALEEQERMVEQEGATVMYENEEIEEEPVDIKPAILSLQTVKQEIQEIQEIQEHHVEYDSEPPEDDPPETYPEDHEIANFQPPSSIHGEQSQDNLIEYHNHIEDDNLQQSEENSASSAPPETYEDQQPQITNDLDSEDFEHVEVSPDVDLGQTIAPDAEQSEEFTNHENNLNDSDVDDYQIVEGVHITGDVDVEKPSNNANILKHVLKSNKEPQKPKKENRLFLYVVQHPEKENVDSLSLEMSNLVRPKVNPRSILKSSHAMFQAKNEMESAQAQDERLSKRFARCKEAMQARIFHNFINKTTIPQAPVRKNRLPRKQKIKPVERMDEEIVVQEVMVSSNGFVEAIGSEGVNKENLAVTEYVELTDSDDDYDPKKSHRKKKKHRKKRIEITTISDDSDAASVIELDESDDDPPFPLTPSKRCRGRPPKNHKPFGESPTKQSRPEPIEAPTKPEIPCPRCDKTFPSHNSLKTHLQHHNLQTSIKNALPEYKYKCGDCSVTFKNSVLLKRHACTNDKYKDKYKCGDCAQAFRNEVMLKRHACAKRVVCPVCKKRFGDVGELGVHRRIHAKELLMKSTTAVKVSPRRTRMQGSGGFKAPSGLNKCRTCGKLCSSIQNLTVHMKSHREYICATCSVPFVSHLMLEKHVRENCVKSPQNGRRSTRIRSSILPVATARLRLKSEASLRKSPATRSRLSGWIKVMCDGCGVQFPSHQALFKHKVLKHGLDTPDKGVVEREEDAKEVRGVPAAKRLKNAFAGLRCELDFKE